MISTIGFWMTLVAHFVATAGLFPAGGYLPFEDQNTSALYRKILNADYQAPGPGNLALG